MALHPWQERVIAERSELGAKIVSLHTYIETSSAFQHLDAIGKALLEAQLHAMQAYKRILDLRISQF